MDVKHSTYANVEDADKNFHRNRQNWKKCEYNFLCISVFVYSVFVSNEKVHSSVETKKKCNETGYVWT